MKTETPRTDAAIHQAQQAILSIVPDIGIDQRNILHAYMLLIASSAIIDHLNEQSQRK